jgi:hypothetical protein
VVVEFWSEIAQDKDDQDEEWFDVLFFLAAEGATRDGAFLLSETELMRVGSSVEYLDMS